MSSNGSNVAKLAREAVERIIRDMTDRRGFRASWSDCDAKTQGEIRCEWTRLVVEAFAGTAPASEAAPVATVTNAKGPQGETVGRVVHYIATPEDTDSREARSRPWCALITAVHEDGTVDLALFPPAAALAVHGERMFVPERVPFAATPTPGHWSWPPKV